MQDKTLRQSVTAMMPFGFFYASALPATFTSSNSARPIKGSQDKRDGECGTYVVLDTNVFISCLSLVHALVVQSCGLIVVIPNIG